MRWPLLWLCWAAGCSGTVGEVLVPVVPDLGSLDAAGPLDSGDCAYKALGGPAAGICLTEGSWIMLAIQTCGGMGPPQDIVPLYPGGEGQTCDASTFGGVAFLCCPRD
jgi:hypothetical protein